LACGLDICFVTYIQRDMFTRDHRAISLANFGQVDSGVDHFVIFRNAFTASNRRRQMR